MKEIKVKELTLENFKPFGSFSQMVNPTARGNGIGGMSFHADLEVLEMGSAHAAAFSTTRVTNQLKPVVLALENHSHCGEGIMSLDNDMLVYFAPAGADLAHAIEELCAFRVPSGVMLTIRPGVWHCMPFTVDTEVVNVLNVLPERTYANDCEMHILKEEERVAIIV
ncbi:MAG: hypothetical protein HFH23_12180 [Ruminococcus sp.]|jgi:ureidoglycolate lyase|nr:hypothetical protein [Ruminococcus sp.]